MQQTGAFNEIQVTSKAFDEKKKDSRADHGSASFSVGGPTPGTTTAGFPPPLGLTDEAMEGKKPRKSKKNQNWTPTPIEDDQKPVSARRTLKHK